MTCIFSLSHRIHFEMNQSLQLSDHSNQALGSQCALFDHANLIHWNFSLASRPWRRAAEKYSRASTRNLARYSPKHHNSQNMSTPIPFRLPWRAIVRSAVSTLYSAVVFRQKLMQLPPDQAINLPTDTTMRDTTSITKIRLR